MMDVKIRFVLIAFAVLLAPLASFAQDTQYWNLQYGTRGELLGGVVVGSALDMSATFYNPASIAWVDNPSFILTASVFGMQTFKVLDQDPDQEAITSQSFGPLPSMIAGVLPMKWFGGKTAYSFLTRQQLNFRLVAREGVIVGRDDPADTLSVGGEVTLTENMGENWGGFSWAKKIGQRAAIGTTLYGVYRSQYTRSDQTVEALGAAGYGSTVILQHELDYYDVRTLMKFGVYFDLGETGTVGLAFTTPSLDLFGSAKIMDNRSLIGDADGNGTDDSAAEVSFGEGLDTEYRSPFSIAVGGSHKFKRLTMHATVEYFGAVDQYNVADSPVEPTGPGVTGVEIAYQAALKSVVNWGFGFEQGFGDKSTAYVSFITDNAAYETVDEHRTEVSTWDIKHINGGVAFGIKDVDLTLGGGFAWGQNKSQDDGYPGTGVLPATIVPAGVGYTRLKFIVGFAL
jgi:hypothetical protein